MQCSAQGVRTSKGRCFEQRNFELLFFLFYSLFLSFPIFPLFGSALFLTKVKICRSSLFLLLSPSSFIAREVDGVGGRIIYRVIVRYWPKYSCMNTGVYTHAPLHVHTLILFHPCLDFVKIRRRTLHF